MNKSELIAAMDAHDAEGERLQKAATELGLDAKSIKAIRKAEKAAESARKTLAALMGIDPEVAVQIAPEPQPESALETVSEEIADKKVKS